MGTLHIVTHPLEGHFLLSQHRADGSVRTNEDGSVRFVDDKLKANPCLQVQCYQSLDIYFRYVWDGVGVTALDKQLASVAQPSLALALRRLGHSFRGSDAQLAGAIIEPFVSWCEQFPTDSLSVVWGPRWDWGEEYTFGLPNYQRQLEELQRLEERWRRNTESV